MSNEITELQRLWLLAQSERSDEGCARYLCDLMFPIFSKACANSSTIAYKLTFGDGRALTSVVCRTYSKVVDLSVGVSGVNTTMSSQRYAVLVSYLSTLLEPEYYRAANGCDESRVDAILADIRIHILRHDIFKIMLSLHNIFLEGVNGQSMTFSDSTIAAEQSHLAFFKSMLETCDPRVLAEAASLRCFQSIMSTLTICYMNPIRGSSSLTRMAADALDTVIESEAISSVVATETALLSEEDAIMNCLLEDARRGGSWSLDAALGGQKLSTLSHCIHIVHLLRAASRTSRPVRYEILIEAFLSLQGVMGLQKTVVEGVFEEYLRFAFSSVLVMAPKKKEKGITGMFGLKKKLASMVFAKEDVLHEEVRFEAECLHKAMDFVRRCTAPEPRLWFTSRLCECLLKVDTPNGPDGKTTALILYDMCQRALECEAELLKKVLGTLDFIASQASESVDLTDILSALAKYLDTDVDASKQEVVVRFFTRLASANNQQLLQRTGEYSIVVASCKVINGMSANVDDLDEASIDVAESIFCLWKILLISDAFIADFVQGMSLANLVKCTLAGTHRPSNIKFIVASRNALVSLVQQRRDSVGALLTAVRDLREWEKDTTAHCVNLAVAIYGAHCHEEVIAQGGIAVLFGLLGIVEHSTTYAFNLHVISFILSMLMPTVRWTELPTLLGQHIPPTLINTMEMVRFVLVVGCGLGVQSQLLSIMLDACYSDLGDPSINAVLCIEESPLQTQLCELEPLIRLLVDWYLLAPSEEVRAAITWMVKAYRVPIADAAFCRLVLNDFWEDLLPFVGNFSDLFLAEASIEVGGSSDDSSSNATADLIRAWYAVSRPVFSRHAVTFLGNGGGGASGRLELSSPSWPPMNGMSFSGWFYCSHDGDAGFASSAMPALVPLWRLKWHYGGDSESALSLHYDPVGRTLLLRRDGQRSESSTVAVSGRIDIQWTHVCIVMHRWQNDASFYLNGSLAASGKVPFEYPVVLREGGVLVTNRLDVTLGFPQQQGHKRHIACSQSISMIGFQIFEGPLVPDHVLNLVSAPFHVRDPSVLVSSGATSISLSAPVLTNSVLRRFARADIGTMVRQAASSGLPLRVRVPDVPILLSIHPSVMSRAQIKSGCSTTAVMRMPNMMSAPCQCQLYGRFSSPSSECSSPIGSFLAFSGPQLWIRWLSNGEALGKSAIMLCLNFVGECIAEGLEVAELMEREHYYCLAAVISKSARFFSEDLSILQAVCALAIRPVDSHAVVTNSPLAEMLLFNWSFLSQLRENAARDVLQTLGDCLNANNPYHRLNAWRLRKAGFVEGFICGMSRYYILPRVLGSARDVIVRFIQALLWDQSVITEISIYLLSTVPKSKDYSTHLSRMGCPLPIGYMFHLDAVRNITLDALLRCVTVACNATHDISGAIPPSWFSLMTSEESHPVTVALTMSIFATLYNGFGTFRARSLKSHTLRALQGTLHYHAANEDVIGIISDMAVNVTRDVLRDVPVIGSESTRGQQIHSAMLPLLLNLTKSCGLSLRPSTTSVKTVRACTYLKRFSQVGASSSGFRPKRFYAIAMSIMRLGRVRRPYCLDTSDDRPPHSPATVRGDNDQKAGLVAESLRFVARLLREHEPIAKLFFVKDGTSPLETISWSVIASIDASEPSSQRLPSQRSSDSLNSDFDVLERPPLGTEGISPKYPGLLEAALGVYTELMTSILSQYEVFTSNTFSVKSCDVVFWLHTTLCSHPPGIGDQSKGWFQSKVIDAWLAASLGVSRRLADSSSSIRTRNCHQIALYVLERLVAGFSVPIRALGNYLRGFKTTGNIEVVKSLEIAMFDFVAFLASEQFHEWSPAKVTVALNFLHEFRDAFAIPIPATMADAARSMLKHLLEMTMSVVCQRADCDPAVMTNDEVLIADMWAVIVAKNRSHLQPLLTEPRNRIDLVVGGFDRAPMAESKADRTAFIMWLFTNATQINTLIHTAGGVPDEQRYLLCLPKRVQGWSQRSEDEIHAERGQHQAKIHEAERGGEAVWSRHAFSGSTIDPSLLDVLQGGQYAQRPFVVSASIQGGGGVTHLNLGSVAGSALSPDASTHLLQCGAVPLGALLSHAGDGCAPLPMSDSFGSDGVQSLLKPTAHRIIEKVLEGGCTEVRGAPVLWAGNVYHVTGNESLICLMVITSYEVVIISSSQVTLDGNVFVSSLETHEANKAAHKKGAMVENVIRRFIPKAPIPSSLTSSSLSTFRHSQYFRQLRTEAKAVQRDSRVWRFPLATLSLASHRHFQHEAAAVEFVLEDSTRLFVVFLDKDLVMSRDARKTVVDIISGQAPHMEIDTNTAKRGRAMVAQRRWLKRQISNYDYLMILNDAASRTFADLTQYPVMPWVLSCYNELFIDLEHARYFRDLSWPLGALDETRRRDVANRYAEWLDDATPPFHYGTHYSTSAIVMYFLVRLQPLTHYATAYQGGRLDVADRLFHSIEEAWTSCSSATGRDVKELIPEFFSLQQFLVNGNQIDLGTRRDGVTLSDVQLPFWATSTGAFIHTNREALESDRVSAMLHLWIDLIFGYKQEGEEAVKACNVFHHLTYASGFESAMTSAASEEDRKAIVASVDNFGLTPKNVFKTSHPRRQVYHPFRSHNDHFAQVMSQLQIRQSTGQMCDVHCAGQPIRSIVDHEGTLLLSTFNRRTTSVKPLQHFVIDVTRNLVMNYRVKDQCSTMLPDLSPFGIGSITCFDSMPSGNMVFVGTSLGTVAVLSRTSWTSRHTIAHLLHVERGTPITLLTYLGGGRLVVGAGSQVGMWHFTRRGPTHQWTCRANRHAVGDSSPVHSAALTGDALDSVVVLKDRSLYVIVNGEVATAAPISNSSAGTSTFMSIGYFNFSSASTSTMFCCGHSDGRVSFWSLSSNFATKGATEDRNDIYTVSHIVSRQIDVQGSASAITCILIQPQTFSFVVGCRSGALWQASLPQPLVDAFYGDI